MIQAEPARVRRDCRRATALEKIFHDDGRAPLPVGLSTAQQGITVRGGALSNKKRRLEQHERTDDARCLEGQLQRDAAAEGMPNHMRTRYPQGPQDSLAVGCLPFATGRPLDAAAAAVAAPMIRDQPITLGQARLIDQRPERIDDERAVHEDYWIAGAGLVIRDGDAINLNVRHGHLSA